MSTNRGLVKPIKTPVNFQLARLESLVLSFLFRQTERETWGSWSTCQTGEPSFQPDSSMLENQTRQKEGGLGLDPAGGSQGWNLCYRIRDLAARLTNQRLSNPSLCSATDDWVSLISVLSVLNIHGQEYRTCTIQRVMMYLIVAGYWQERWSRPTEWEKKNSSHA